MALDIAARTERAQELIAQGVPSNTAYQIATAEQTDGNIAQQMGTGYTEYLPATPMYENWTLPSNYTQVSPSAAVSNVTGGTTQPVYPTQTPQATVDETNWWTGGTVYGAYACPYGDGATFGNQDALNSHILTVHGGVMPSTTTGTTTTGTNTDASIWEVNPEQAYLNQLGIGAIGLTPYQKWQANQFAPTYASYLLGTRLNPVAEGSTPINFGDYLNSNGGIMGARRDSTSLFNQLLGTDTTTQRDIWDLLGSYGNDLVANVLGQRYGRPVSSVMANNYSNLQSAFEGGPGYSDTTSSFAEWLLSKYGLR